MREILVMTSHTSAHTDCRGGGGEARQPLGRGVFGQFSLAGNCAAALHLPTHVFRNRIKSRIEHERREILKTSQGRRRR